MQPQGLTAAALHNALAQVVDAYGLALADQERVVALLKAGNTQLLAENAKLRAECEELRKGLTTRVVSPPVEVEHPEVTKWLDGDS